VDRLIAFLRSEGATQMRHGRRPLLGHLIGTYEIVRRWNQPVALQHAALIHSVYGTDVYRQQLLPRSRRDELIEVAGGEAERLAFLFSVTARDHLLAGTHVWTTNATMPFGGGEPTTSGQPAATRAELDALVLLHMANLAEQARAEDGSPGLWLVRLRELAELLITSDTVVLPLFIAELATLSDDDEATTRRAYCAGLAEGADPGVKAQQLALAAAGCPVVAEPCVWQAHLSRCRGDLSLATSWARAARRRLVGLGAAWDKRLSFDEWLRLAELLQRPDRTELPTASATISDPRMLLDALTGADSGQHSQPNSPTPLTSREAAAGKERFGRYVETLLEPHGPEARGIYPHLDSRPWYDPAAFELTSYLQSHFAEIRDEVLALDPSRFQRESERIRRTGDWDVVFLYERGRRRDEVCDACPVTTHGIETHAAMRTVSGLIYVSRMRAGTHIRAHRGPTNLRLRCHLGIEVPDGDCAIRVSDETRRWREGECLVFDDHFEHEAWNHTTGDRIVLIVDLWHPDLSMTEVRLLEGLHRYVYAHARQLNRYWSSNDAAAKGPTRV
jgi:aspartate beta-hydroxylase